KTKIVRAFAVRDGRFLAVGDNDDVMRFSGRNTRKVNLKGRTVIPGLADGHFHSIGGGPGMDLSQTRSLADLFAVVAKAAQAAALLDTQSRMNSMGVTAVRNALSSVAVYRRWQALRDEGAISLRNAFLIGGLGTAAAVENFVATSGVQPNEGDDWLRLVGLKFISDGGFEGGLMRDPYKEPYGHGGTYHGLQAVN